MNALRLEATSLLSQVIKHKIQSDGVEENFIHL